MYETELQIIGKIKECNFLIYMKNIIIIQVLLCNQKNMI